MTSRNSNSGPVITTGVLVARSRWKLQEMPCTEAGRPVTMDMLSGQVAATCGPIHERHFVSGPPDDGAMPARRMPLRGMSLPAVLSNP